MFPETNILFYFADLGDLKTGKDTTHPLVNIIMLGLLAISIQLKAPRQLQFRHDLSA
jgi:hypothetical protein